MPKRLIITADSHTQGEPTRLIIGGVIHYPGNTMLEKREYIQQQLDGVRQSIIGEPRGHQDMFGGFITDPVTDAAQLGIIYMDNQGYLDMCGHGTIGLVTTVVELGLVEPTGTRTEFGIDTPAGFVQGYAISENGTVIRAGFHNVPSFCLTTATDITVEGFGTLQVGIAYGGNFFAILPAESVGLELELDNQEKIRELGLLVKSAANEQLDVVHPLNSDVSGVDIVTFYGKPKDEKAAYRNVHIFADGQVDRSPGGTGTSAMLAYFLAREDINQDDLTISEGLANGHFEGKIVNTWQEKNVCFITPDISSRAFLTGIHTFYLDSEDPMLLGL